MGRKCRNTGGIRNGYDSLVRRSLRGRNYLVSLLVDGRTISKKDVTKAVLNDMQTIRLAQTGTDI
jgi:hypothetical protein